MEIICYAILLLLAIILFKFIFKINIKKIKEKQENKELENIMAEIDSNLSNNYKDAAHEALDLLEQRLSELTAEGRLKEKARKEYETKLASYQGTLKGFSHKDQKPYWDSKS